MFVSSFFLWSSQLIYFGGPIMTPIRLKYLEGGSLNTNSPSLGLRTAHFCVYQNGVGDLDFISSLL